MEDTTMLDASQALFADLVFVIIPNGIPDQQQDQACRRVVPASSLKLTDYLDQERYCRTWRHCPAV